MMTKLAHKKQIDLIDKMASKGPNVIKNKRKHGDASGKYQTPPSGLRIKINTKRTNSGSISSSSNSNKSPTDHERQLQEELLRKEFVEAQKKTAHMTSNENTTSHLRRYIRKEIYPRKKFITGEKDLMFETKMAKKIVGAMCTIDDRFPDLQREWWENREKKDRR